MTSKVYKIVWVRIVAIAFMAVVAVAAVWMLHKAATTSYVEIGSDPEINITPQKISEIKRLRQWEFTRVMDEVVIDTVVHRTLLPDNRLTCIYYGTLSLGIDLDKAADDWAACSNDTVRLRLPKPSILDDNFIDEARTKVFYENGAWRASAKNAMYRRAKVKMMSRALTPDNLRRVERAAAERFTSLFKELGAKEVIVEFEE